MATNNPTGHVLAYRDELGPAYSLGLGVAAPGNTALAGGLSNIRGLTFGPGDTADVVVQVNHDAMIPPTGNVTLDAHVHWTAVAAPAAGATVIWKFEFLGARPSTGNVSFPSTSTTLTTPTYTCDGNETLKNMYSDMGDVVIPSTSYAPSYILWGTLSMSTAATVAAAKVALLSFDLHKLVDRFGSTSEDL